MRNIDDTIYYITRHEEEQHSEELAKKLGLPYINLSSYPIVKEVLDLIPENDVIIHQIVPYLRVGSQIKIGVVDPESTEVSDYLAKLEKTMGVTFLKSVISKSSLFYGVSKYEEFKRKEMVERSQVNQQKKEEQSFNIKDIQSASEAAKKASTTRLLDTILIGAMKLAASDIHFEPAEQNFLTRYRIDGVLQDIVSLPTEKYKQIVQRIKYLSSLRMDITDKPQDGRFSFAGIGDIPIDFRVSIMPSAYGESIVLRILNMDKELIRLDSMGFRPDALIAIRQAISKPHGMVLTSGPTGSGKSTTLYAVLMELKKPGVKIITLEDPVEYKIPGVEQSQIKTGEGYEFADGLRASLRQDPDILMVGEIRDLETAEIGIQSALTGHLLLSTIHANSAPAVYARLLEMGVKPFLLSGAMNLIMAQRLVRKVCPDCAEKYAASADEWKSIVQLLSPIASRLPAQVAKDITSPSGTLNRAVGCVKCNNTGFIGREIVVEYLVPDDAIETLIAQKASISSFEKVAKAQGMITMEQDGLAKAVLGETTVEEVWRVTKS